MLKKYKTFIFYTTFYLVFLGTSFVAMFYIIKINLTEAIETSLSKQLEKNVSALSESLERDFIDLSQLSVEIKTQLQVEKGQYQSADYVKFVMYQLLRGYATNNPLIVDIICYSNNNDDLYSQHYLATQQDDILTIVNNQQQATIAQADIIQNSNQLIALPYNGEENLVLYIPPYKMNDYQVVFVIDTKVLQNQFRAAYLPNVRTMQLSNGKNLLFEDETLTFEDTKNYQSHAFVCNYPTLDITVWTDEQITKDMYADSLSVPYLILFATSCTGLICFFFFMKTTYIPLKNFAQNIQKEMVQERNNEDIINLHTIGTLFDTIRAENKQMVATLHQYHMEIQKSMLSTISSSHDSILEEQELDLLFNENPRHIYVVHCIFDTPNTATWLCAQWAKQLPPTQSKWFTLEQEDELLTVLLVGEGDYLAQKQEVLSLIETLQQTVPFECYCSEASTSIMDFPRLYSQVMQDSMQQLIDARKPQVGAKAEAHYPYQSIDAMGTHLSQNNHPEAQHYLTEIFVQLETNRYPDFFIQSIYLDIITLIFNQFSAKNLNFSKYSALYYKTLALCKSKDYTHKHKIHDSIMQLMQIHTKLLELPALTFAHVEECIKAHYTEESFSITELSEQYQISTSQFSVWFHKETGVNFRDYVWNLRFQLAISMMQTTPKTTKEIAECVGYPNYTSFSRKFKDHTGQSPSEYKATHC